MLVLDWDRARRIRTCVIGGSDSMTKSGARTQSSVGACQIFDAHFFEIPLYREPRRALSNVYAQGSVRNVRFRC